jgi:hypothetical protein
MRSPCDARPATRWAALAALAVATLLAATACGGSSTPSQTQDADQTHAPSQSQSQTQSQSGATGTTGATAQVTAGAASALAPSGSVGSDGPEGTRADLTVRTEAGTACWTYSLAQNSAGGQSNASAGACGPARGDAMRLFGSPTQVANGSGPGYTVVGGTAPSGTSRVELRYPDAPTVRAAVGSGLFVAVVPADIARRTGSAVAMGSDGRAMATVTVPAS